ncbi:MAG: hypothetical protein JKX84_05960 [Flavobacteriales bacterium]|nr:hypothetical protein [Flavobacteriales bacterium]
MKKGLVLLSVVLLLGSCLKRNDYPNRPNIEFISYTLRTDIAVGGDSIGTVKFSFTDGDGDLGLNAKDTFGVNAPGQPYHFNLFIRHFQKQNGVYVEFVATNPSFNVRFKNLTPTGRDKTLEGEMDVGIGSQPGSPFDTIRYEMYIVDRALQHSDTIVTPDIILPF